jgi:8-hydroxy-5-deazaflavin:NADPH oxidoreductase
LRKDPDAPADLKSVGIIGGGRIGQVMARIASRIGQVMARIASRVGRQVVIANRRGPESLTAVVQDLGDGVGGRDGKGRGSGVYRRARRDVTGHLADRRGVGVWEGRIVTDPTNDFDPSDLDGRTSSEVVADLVAPARLVKAGNTLGGRARFEPPSSGGHRVIFVSGDDADAMTEVVALFDEAGFFAIDLGGCARAAVCNRSVPRWPATT